MTGGFSFDPGGLLSPTTQEKLSYPTIPVVMDIDSEINAEVDEYVKSINMVLTDFLAEQIPHAVLSKSKTLLNSIGFDQTILNQLTVLKSRSGDRAEMFRLLDGYADRDIVMDLYENGMESFMLKNFSPSGIKGFRQSKKYYDNREVINNSYAKMVLEGTALAFNVNDIPQNIGCRINTLQWIHQSTQGWRPSRTIYHQLFVGGEKFLQCPR